MYERYGGLMLCACGHAKAFHFQRPKWYGGPLTEGAPCAHCDDCEKYEQGDYQGLEFREATHAR